MQVWHQARKGEKRIQKEQPWEMIKVVNRETIILSFNPWVRKIPWRRKWQPTPVFLPGEPHGQRSLVGYSPQSCNELDMIEQLTTVLDGVTTEIFCRWQLVCAHFTGQNMTLLFINDITVLFLGPVSYMYLCISVYIYTHIYIYIHLHIYVF